MMTDAILLQVDYTVNKETQPIVGKRMISGDDDIQVPLLQGYIRATLKGGAQEGMMTESGHPIYTQWHYGAGKAASFMSDLGGKWSEAWFEEASGKALIMQLIQGLIPDVRNENAIVAEIDRGGVEGVLKLECAELLTRQSFTADIVAPDGTTHHFALNRGSANDYERSFPISGSGKYIITLKRYDMQSNLLGEYHTAAAVSWSKEYQTMSNDDAMSQMSEICAITGGVVGSSIEELLQADMETLYVDYDLALPLAVIMGICLMLDITVRKTGLKRFRKGIRKM